MGAVELKNINRRLSKQRSFYMGGGQILEAVWHDLSGELQRLSRSSFVLTNYGILDKL